MVFVALLAVTGSVPALAVAPDQEAVLLADKPTTRLQSMAPGATATVAVQRDSVSVVAAPKPPPVVKSKSAGSTSGGSLGIDLGQLAGQPWAVPASGSIISPFGERPEAPVAGVSSFHKGSDIVAPCGQPVYAATAGTVVEAGGSGSYGNWIMIDHGEGVKTGYAHNSELLVSEGQTVAAGEQIAAVGSTGASSGCHLHFEVRINDAPLDPEPFMSARGVPIG